MLPKNLRFRPMRSRFDAGQLMSPKPCSVGMVKRVPQGAPAIRHALRWQRETCAPRQARLKSKDSRVRMEFVEIGAHGAAARSGQRNVDAASIEPVGLALDEALRFKGADPA